MYVPEGKEVGSSSFGLTTFCSLLLYSSGVVQHNFSAHRCAQSSNLAQEIKDKKGIMSAEARRTYRKKEKQREKEVDM